MVTACRPKSRPKDHSTCGSEYLLFQWPNNPIANQLQNTALAYSPVYIPYSTVANSNNNVSVALKLQILGTTPFHPSPRPLAHPDCLFREYLIWQLKFLLGELGHRKSKGKNGSAALASSNSGVSKMTLVKEG